MSSKDFDLIVFGATSFTGKLVVEYLDNNYKDNISWALAGRNKEKLEAVKEQLSCDAPILIIDSESQNDIQNALGLKGEGETDSGKFTLKYNTCLGACSQAPVISINHDFIGNTTSEDILKILLKIDPKL